MSATSVKGVRQLPPGPPARAPWEIASRVVRAECLRGYGPRREGGGGVGGCTHRRCREQGEIWETRCFAFVATGRVPDGLFCRGMLRERR